LINHIINKIHWQNKTQPINQPKNQKIQNDTQNLDKIVKCKDTFNNFALSEFIFIMLIIILSCANCFSFYYICSNLQLADIQPNVEMTNYRLYNERPVNEVTVEAVSVRAVPVETVPVN